METEPTLREGLARYYRANPNFQRDQDLQVGWIQVPWRDLQKHDMMHVVTGYSTDLDQELRLLGFLLSALSWRRPWYFYLQSFGVFLELLAKSCLGRAFGERYFYPWQVCGFYLDGLIQGRTVRKKIDAYIEPESVMDRSLRSLREEYGIRNAGAWNGYL